MDALLELLEQYRCHLNRGDKSTSNFLEDNYNDYLKDLRSAASRPEDNPLSGKEMCDMVECHSWYLQQYAFFIWYATEKVADEYIVNRSLIHLIDINSPMFISDVEKLTPSQKSMLRAISDGQTKLSSEEVRTKYNLGNPNTIQRNKLVLQEKAFIDVENGELYISDPVFKLWFKDQRR